MALFRGSGRFESLSFRTIPGIKLHVSVMKRILIMMMMMVPQKDSSHATCVFLRAIIVNPGGAEVQGYLAHKKQPPPPRTTIGP